MTTSTAERRLTRTLRAVLYVRISEDPLLLERGVKRQEEDVRELAGSREDWRVICEPLIDNDVSAFRGRRREAFERLKAMVQAGEVDVVVVYMTSRLWRNRRERAECFELFQKARVRVVPVKGPELDFSSASGRMVAGVLGEVDEHESAVKAERVERAARERREKGVANGPCLYGWRREYEHDARGRVTGFTDVEDPTTAAVVREIVDRILRGDSLIGITADLNARGVPAPASARWGKTSVKKIAMREANVALRSHQRQVVGPAAWPAIIDPGKHARVKALLDDPARKQSRGGARRHLLTMGIGECGVCHGVLRVQVKRGKSQQGHYLYTCQENACVGRRQERVDELVHVFAIARLETGEGLAALSVAPDLLQFAEDKVAELRARMDTAADRFADGLITAEQLDRINARVLPQIRQGELDLARLRGPNAEVLQGLTGPNAERLWRDAPVQRQRAVLESWGIRVVVERTRQGKGFDPFSVQILPREQQG